LAKKPPFDDPQIAREYFLYKETGDASAFRKVVCHRYRDRISASIRSRGVRDSEVVQDLTQDVLLRVLDKGHLEKYDSTRSRFPTHMYTVINSIVVNRYRRGRTDPMYRSYSIHPGDGASEEAFRPGILFAGRIPSGLRSQLEDATTIRLLRIFKERMTERHLWSGPVQKRAILKDTSVNNNLWQVFTWLYLSDPYFWVPGEQKREESIAQFLGVTTGSVTNWKGRIRQVASKVFRDLGLRNEEEVEWEIKRRQRPASNPV